MVPEPDLRLFVLSGRTQRVLDPPRSRAARLGAVETGNVLSFNDE